jgi:hypothetical protein
LTTKAGNHRNYIITGILLLLIIFFFKPRQIDKVDLDTLSVTVSSIRKLGGKGKYAYYFWSKEYKCTFGIDKVGGIAAHWTLDSSIKAGDNMTIQLFPQSYESLHNDGAPIIVYSILKDGMKIFDLDEYNYNNTLRNKRINFLLLIPAILFLCRGLNLISSKKLWWIGAISIVAVLLMRIFNIWLW